MVVKRNPPPSSKATGLGFADVVEQGSQSQYQVWITHRLVRRLKLNCLREHRREAVLVHILVPVVFVNLNFNAGSSGKT